ncbi:MAG: aspartate--tRNA(Asn) ligase [Myxococcales bacterium]|nr:aspartate--tRNA(Asn) ligase [Myxococcales bacterium]
MIEAIRPMQRTPEPTVDAVGDWCGLVHQVRRLSARTFLKLWLPRGLVQIVCAEAPEGVRAGATVRVRGRVVAATLRDATLYWRSLEIAATEVEIVASPAPEGMPFDLTRPELVATPQTRLDHRPASLRHPRIRAAFTIQAALVRAFRAHLDGLGFTEIRSPKLGSEGAEGGADVFDLDYFGRRAVLAQSPQFYKEMCTGVFGRVYEVGPVFRAEPHATRRHLNEYTSLDVELGPIGSFTEVMSLQVGLLAAMMQQLEQDCSHELALLEIELPEVHTIPALRFAEAKKITGGTGHDLAPAEEAALGRWAQSEHGSQWLYVTHYPTAKRPFYAMDTPGEPSVTDSFDLLFRGTEITTGGQRIHDPGELEAKIRSRGMDPAGFAFFLQAHRCGLPPHGGFGLGLERMTALLCGIDNVRDATLFPRDAHRLTP